MYKKKLDFFLNANFFGCQLLNFVKKKKITGKNFFKEVFLLQFKVLKYLPIFFLQKLVENTSLKKFFFLTKFNRKKSLLDFLFLLETHLFGNILNTTSFFRKPFFLYTLFYPTFFFKKINFSILRFKRWSLLNFFKKCFFSFSFLNLNVLHFFFYKLKSRSSFNFSEIFSLKIKNKFLLSLKEIYFFVRFNFLRKFFRYFSKFYLEKKKNFNLITFFKKLNFKPTALFLLKQNLSLIKQNLFLSFFISFFLSFNFSKFDKVLFLKLTGYKMYVKLKNFKYIFFNFFFQKFINNKIYSKVYFLRNYFIKFYAAYLSSTILYFNNYFLIKETYFDSFIKKSNYANYLSKFFFLTFNFILNFNKFNFINKKKIKFIKIYSFFYFLLKKNLFKNKLSFFLFKNKLSFFLFKNKLSFFLFKNKLSFFLFKNKLSFFLFKNKIITNQFFFPLKINIYKKFFLFDFSRQYQTFIIRFHEYSNISYVPTFSNFSSFTKKINFGNLEYLKFSARKDLLIYINNHIGHSEILLNFNFFKNKLTLVESKDFFLDLFINLNKSFLAENFRYSKFPKLIFFFKFFFFKFFLFFQIYF